MARRTFQVIDVVEVLQHWHAGRPVVMSGRNDDGNEFGLLSRVVGGLPIVNHMLDRLGLPALIAGALPPEDARVQLAPAVAIRLVVTNLVLGREPRYGLGEWAARCDPAQVVVSFAAANRDEAVFPDPNVFE